VRGRSGSPVRRRRLVLLVAVAVILAGLVAWLWEDLTSNQSVYVVGDSITYLSEAPISADLSNAGYQPTISATPGVKIGQSEDKIAALAQSQPYAWIIELGTNDAGARDTVWPQQFLAEWSAISPASCVLYVTVSPRAGAVAQQINASIQKLAQTQHNVHVLDWGNIEYQNPGWVSGDGIHPTTAGQAALAALETQELHRDCSSGLLGHLHSNGQ
jgi:lysophospholipase L1-like esterase